MLNGLKWCVGFGLLLWSMGCLNTSPIHEGYPCLDDSDCGGLFCDNFQCKLEPCVKPSRACYVGKTGCTKDGEQFNCTSPCRSGTQSCINGFWGSCEGQTLPNEEVCDGKDNNCDGQTDETFPNKGQSCPFKGDGGQDKGVDGTLVCKDGKKVCDIVDFANIRAKDKSIKMGSETTSPIHEDDEARTKVQFEYNYSLARAEVTQGQFKRLMGYNPSTNKNDNFPVSGVSWHEAAFYANELSKEQGLEQCFSCSGTFTKGTPYTGTCVVSQKYVNESDYAKFCPGFRLPTEAEWFYAYYAGNQLYKSFYSGNIESKANDCTEGDDTLKQIATFCSDKPTAIETHNPNDWNLYDMSGNVAEWVYDYYEKILESTNTNRVGPPVEKVAVKERVYKGGHFKSPPRECRGASRFKADPTTQDQTIGFRIARTLAE